jgi:hypothetical protein
MWRWVSTESSGTHALSDAAVTNHSRRGLWQLCRQGAIRVFSGTFELAMASTSCGSHRIKTIAKVGEAQSELTFTIDVSCPVDVVMDATRISWVVEAGKAATVVGDADPTTTGAPTLTNRGSRPAQIGVLFTPLTRPDIDSKGDGFSVAVQTATGAPTKADRLLAGVRVWLDQDGFTLCPGESAQLTLTLHAGAQLVEGTYSGRVSILAREGGSC